MSGRLAILTELRTRLRRISTANGFHTEAGLLVLLGEQPTLGPDDPDAAIAIMVSADEPGYQGEHVVTRLPIEVQALAKADLDQVWVTIEEVIEDIKKAVETDHTLGDRLLSRGLERGSTRPLDREESSTTIGAAVEYRLLFKELWGAP